MSDKPITIAETTVFRRVVESCMSEDELEAFKYFISRNPEIGDIIRGTGGVRKIRWGIGGSGKSGGARIIYYFMNANHPIYLLTVFKKANKASLNATQKNAMKELVAFIKQDAR